MLKRLSYDQIIYLEADIVLFAHKIVTILLYFLVQNEIYGRPTGTSL
jgi:hypothetical protein